MVDSLRVKHSSTCGNWELSRIQVEDYGFMSLQLNSAFVANGQSV